ncbi:protein of unknown function [Moritella yayanosii]|uniref:Uncharacterized protein n=1 Tax=Moritella yayanosii TaxID=69539 RepID=A0A330LP79_9GAMM|nr:protein of unknown function [Moritella yayanosii]
MRSSLTLSYTYMPRTVFAYIHLHLLTYFYYFTYYITGGR